MVLWWIGNAILLLVVLPVVIFLLNRVLAAVERIRGATDDILTGGVALIGDFDQVSLTDFAWLMDINFWAPVRLTAKHSPLSVPRSRPSRPSLQMRSYLPSHM